MTRLAAWWFAPAPAARLSGVRWLVGGYLLHDLWTHRGGFSAIAQGDPATFRAIGVLSWLDAPLPLGVFDAWAWVNLALGLCFCVGAGFRITGPLFALSNLAFYTYRTSWLMIYHSDNLACLHVIGLALGPSASAYAVDAWLERRGWLRWARWGPQGEDGFGWVLKLLGMVAALTYLLAGVAKVAGDSGFGWASGDNLLDQIGNDALYKELVSSKGAAPLVPWVYAHSRWLVVPAALTLVLELLAPLALLHPWLGRVWAVGVWGLHVGIEQMMGIVFPYPLSGVAYASFFPVERVLDGAAAVGRRVFSR